MVNLVTGSGTAIDNWGNTDTLISIESVQGSASADTLIGATLNQNLVSDLSTIFEGMGGNDTIDGGTNLPTYSTLVPTLIRAVRSRSIWLRVGLRWSGRPGSVEQYRWRHRQCIRR